MFQMKPKVDASSQGAAEARRTPRFRREEPEDFSLPLSAFPQRSLRLCGALRIVFIIFLVSLPAFAFQHRPFDVAAFDRDRVLKAAKSYLSEAPITITASSNPRSAGGAHDFFSEGDYWWPDPQNPDGPYIQRDGMTNPDNFTDHRRYLMRLSVQVPALVAAWKLTGNDRYAGHAAKHLRAWFLDEKTRMNPHLKFAQAIKGRVTGRGIGIIDTIHLVEVARAAELLEASAALSKAERTGIKQWFADYLDWMTTSPYGIEEREAKNNHGTCWVMQVAAFARLTGNQELLGYCRERFKALLIPNQMAGSHRAERRSRRRRSDTERKEDREGIQQIEARAGPPPFCSSPAGRLQ